MVGVLPAEATDVTKYEWDVLNSKLDTITELLYHVLKRERTIMATEQQLLDVISKIDAATTAQGVVLATEAATLQRISDDVDKLIVAAKSAGVQDSTLVALQAQADRIAQVSTSLDQQADFSTALASKADNPVPEPVPPATP